LQKQQNIFIVATDSKEAAVNASTLRQKWWQKGNTISGW
jgi:hypothetical protein